MDCCIFVCVRYSYANQYLSGQVDGDCSCNIWHFSLCKGGGDSGFEFVAAKILQHANKIKKNMSDFSANTSFLSSRGGYAAPPVQHVKVKHTIMAKASQCTGKLLIGVMSVCVSPR